MAPERKPYSLGLGPSENIQDGTLNLQASPKAGAVGATAPPVQPVPILLCEKGHTVFSPTWKSKDGDTSFQDPQAYDALSPEQKKRVDALSSKTDQELKQIFRGFITNSLATGNLGGSMVDQFYDGSQKAMRHAKGSPLAEMARRSASFLAHAADVRDKLGQLLPRPVGTGLANYRFLEKKIVVPTVSFEVTTAAVAAWVTSQTGDELTLKSLIGGTQGLKIFLQDISFLRNHSPGYNMFSVSLRYEIFDNFGVGSDDIYTSFVKEHEDYRGALVAFWILQHMRNGHKPFINWIEVEINLLGGL